MHETYRIRYRRLDDTKHWRFVLTSNQTLGTARHVLLNAENVDTIVTSIDGVATKREVKSVSLL